MVSSCAGVDLEFSLYDSNFLSNFFSVKVFAESEFWFAAIKVFAIVAFIILGVLAITGILPVKGFNHAPCLVNFYKMVGFLTVLVVYSQQC